MSDRVFLDANILVSAAWRPDNGLLALWTLTDVTLLTSAYAIVEADRNVRTPEQRTRLHRLVQRLEIVDEAQVGRLPAHVRLPLKDVPILMAAIQACPQSSRAAWPPWASPRVRSPAIAPPLERASSGGSDAS